MTAGIPLSRRSSVGGGLAAALLFLACWLPLHPATPPLPTADLYTHLMVARHLSRGDGFVTDIAYPLSFAFPFARELPQPLIHRGPGYPLLMVLPYRAAGGDPGGTVRAVRGLQAGILAAVVLLGTATLLRRGRPVAVAPWLVLVAVNPLLVYAVDWGFEELLCGGLLLALWLRVRDGTSTTGLADGLLAGGLALLRLELFWVPVLWWVWFGLERRQAPRGEGRDGPAFVRGLLLALLVLAVVQAPWAVRNLRLTGQPFFTLQSQAELVKDTRPWPEYSVYKQLQPQPLVEVLRGDPVPVARKSFRGMKFFVTELPRMLPWPFLLPSALMVLMLLIGRVAHLPCPFRPGRNEPMSILPAASPLGPLAAVSFTTAVLIVQYSFFDHSLRHLLPVVPVLAWEFAGLTGELAVLAARRLPGRRFGTSTTRIAATGLAAGLVTAAVVWATWTPLTGWAFARAQARQAAQHLPQQVAAFAREPGPVLFVQDSALPWYGDRPAVWDPGKEEVRRVIRGYLGHETGP